MRGSAMSTSPQKPVNKEEEKKHGSWFSRMAHWTSQYAGHPVAFLLAFSSLVVWGVLGPLYHYSDTWQLVANTATSLITFLMVFIIQNSQNRDTKAIHLKLDELIRAVNAAHNEMIDIEKLPEKELEQLASRYERIRGEVQQRRIGSDERDQAA
jgi:low affinity Fe/Cu permease